MTSSGPSASASVRCRGIEVRQGGIHCQTPFPLKFEWLYDTLRAIWGNYFIMAWVFRLLVSTFIHLIPLGDTPQTCFVSISQAERAILCRYY